MVRLIHVTPKAEKLVAYMARVSSPNPENPDIEKLLKYCIKNLRVELLINILLITNIIWVTQFRSIQFEMHL